jgi:Zn-dependent peptidase ImmA (M78 family)
LAAKALATHLEIPLFAPHEIPGITDEILHQLMILDRGKWSAVTIPCNGRGLIIHNTSHAGTRQESNLMHEMSHVICEHKPARITPPGVFPWASRSFDADQEDEAKWLGACLQLPREALLWAIGRRMPNQAIADHFHASEAIVRFRRNVTGIDVQLARSRALRA